MADDYQQMIDDCIARESKLSDWDRTFIDSIGDRVAAERRLSVKQIECLDGIWERVTADG